MKRTTKQRSAIAHALQSSGEFLSAQQLHDRLGDEAPALATVYRTLQALVNEGNADAVTRNGEQVYRACGSSHHHHLVCITCGATTEISGDEIERWAEATATSNGFRLVSHVADIYGVCARCST